MPKLETQQFRSFERGIIQGVDHLLAPKQSVYFAVNVEFDKKIGSGIVRAGSADVGAAIASDALGLCLGLHSFITSADVVHLVLAINDGPSATNSDVYRLNSGTWTITDNINLTKDIKHRFVTFLDTCAVSNGTDAVKTSTDGTTWVSTGGVLNVANMPKFNTMIEWQDRIYGVKNNDDRLIFSSAAAPTMNYDNEAGGPFTVGETITGGTSSATAVISKLVDNGASGHLVLTDVKDTNGIHGTGVFTNNETITGGTSGATGKPDQTDFIGVWWDQTSGAGFIEIEPDDGGGTITALSKVPGYLIIFKERSMKRWNGVSTFPDDLVNIGTPTQESVCLARNTVFFFNERGIYETNGGYPVLRSRPVQDI